MGAGLQLPGFRWLRCGFGVLVAMASLTAVGESAQAACGGAQVCFFKQQNLMGDQKNYGQPSGGETPWTSIGYPGPNMETRSARNNFGNRRVKLAQGLNGDGVPYNVICIRANSQDLGFQTRYYFNIGASGTGNGC